MLAWLEELEKELLKYQTTVKFSENSLSDFKSYDTHTKKVILALILSQAKRGAQFRPDGNGIRLSGELYGFAKIKRTNTSLRIIYRPVENGAIEMQILAIGPRDRNKVYEIAKKRQNTFLREFDQ